MLSARVVHRLGHAAHLVFLATVLSGAAVSSSVSAANVTLAWDQSTDSTVSGYRLYYGAATGSYTNVVDVGASTSATVSNLAPATAYYFAATTYSLAGMESAYSTEVAYVVPSPATNQPPTLNPIPDITINENAGTQTVNLTGITSGSTNEVQVLTVSAFSSNPALIPNPTVNYTSPNTTGTLTFAPMANSYGAVTMTVMVDDGGTTSNTIIRTFGVTVVAPTPVTNLFVAPNTLLQYALTPPVNNHDKYTFSLGAGAPAGVNISPTKKGGNLLLWVPTSAQASTTNLINIVITDLSNPALSTNQNVLVIVQDYLGIALGSASVQAGQTTSVPLYLASSEGVTNTSFTIGWPGNNFLNPSLSNLTAAVGSASLQNLNSNLVVSLRAPLGQPLVGSNLIAQLSFQTITNQPSAFVSLPVVITAGTKPTGVAYANYTSVAGRVAVVNNFPLLDASSLGPSNLTLTLYGKVGAKYQLQSLTTLGSTTNWSALNTYTLTNVAQVVTLSPPGAAAVYRLLQR